MEQNALLYALSTIAQCAAALAALIGFLGLWQLDRLREQVDRLNVHPKDDPSHIHLAILQSRQWWLLWVLRGFIVMTLLILGVTIVSFRYVDQAATSPWTPTLLWIAGVLLAGGPIVVVWIAARLPLTLIILALLLLASPALANPTCTTYEEKTLNRLHTLCSDGTRAISTYNRTLERWDTIVTVSPRKACIGRMNSITKQVEVRCR
jgi:hypothetical protein